MISHKEVNRRFKDLVNAKYEGSASVSEMLDWLIEKKVIQQSQVELFIVRDEYYKRLRVDTAKNAKYDTAIELATSTTKVENAIYYHKDLNL